MNEPHDDQIDPSAATIPTGDAPCSIDDTSPLPPPIQAPPVRIHLAEVIDEDVKVVDERSIPAQCWAWFCTAIAWLFGFASVVAGLAVLATIPIAQFLSLGYLLEVSGRISRTGRITEGFIGIRQAGQMGSIVLGTWMMLLPVRFVSNLWQASRLIDPNSGVTTAWRIGLLLITAVIIGHIVVSWFCGGKLRHFFWPFLAPFFFAMWGVRKVVSSQTLAPIVRPVVGAFSQRLLRDLTRVPALTEWFPPAILFARLRQGGVYVSARDAVWEFAASLRLNYYFWLGLRGFAGALAWLFVPIMLIISTTWLSLDNEAAAQGLGGFAGFIGSVMLAIVVLYLPFMQAHFAAQNRFVAMFELGTVRRLFRQAPIAFWFSLLITLGFALPLYLLKIEAVPSETLWLPSLVFVIFILPARFITGWAMGRAMKRKTPRFFLIRWAARLGALPVVFFYAFIAYFIPYISWYGPVSLFEQHAFLLPVPFVGL